MATSRFGGPLASEFAAFAATLEASATANKTTLTQLRALDRFTAQRSLPSGTIDETLAKAWLAGCVTRAPNTRAARYYLLRRFCRFLAARRPGTFVPGESLRPRRRSPKPPHIYTRDEVRALLAGALRTAGLGQPASLPDPVDHLAHAHPAAGHLRPADLRSAAPHPGRRGPHRGCSADPPVEVPQIPARAGLRRHAGRAAPLPRPARRCGARRSDRGLLRLRSRHRLQHLDGPGAIP